jgi:hypothetical protein
MDGMTNKPGFILEPGFICLDYKPQQISTIGNSFFDRTGSSLGSELLQQLLFSTGSS